MKLKLRWTSIRHLAPLAAALLCSAAAVHGALPASEVVSQNDSQITFTVRLGDYTLSALQAGGETYTSIDAPGMVSVAAEGEPDLPVYVVVLAVPPGGGARLVSSRRSDEAVVEDLTVAPVPRLESEGEGAARLADYKYEPDREVYGRASFPPDLVWLGERGRMRHQDIVKVFVSPFAYEPSAGRLVAAREVTVTVAFEGTAAVGRTVGRDDSWEGVYRNTLLNYDQARAWRVARPRPILGRAVANNRVKILVSTTGIHRLDFATLSGGGFPAYTPVDEIYLYQDSFEEGSPDTLKMVEMAITVNDNDSDDVFSEGDEIIFFAQDIYDQFGRRLNQDEFSDKNVCWLSWGGGGHRRISSKGAWRDAPSPVMPGHFTDFVHIEKDSVFVNYPPRDDIDLFTWRRYSGTFPFDLPDMDTSQPCSLVVQIISYYNNPTGRDRTGWLEFYLQGCSGVQTPLDTVLLYIPSVMDYVYPIGAGVLCEEDNSFRFLSRIDSRYPPGNTLDWFEVFYERRFKARDDMLLFKSSGATGEVQFDITGFSGSDIVLYDVTDPTDPVEMDLGAENIIPDNGLFKLVFQDSLSGPRRYACLCAGCLVPVEPEQISLHGPPALRDVSAEYIIISHPNFTAELGPLITQREAQGRSVLLATTEQVYDDFGNGTKSDRAIQRFIKSCFFGGDAAFVLLVGDGNVDRKGLLLEPPESGGQYPSDVDYLPAHNMFLVDGLPPNKEIRPNENWFVSVDGPDDLYPDLYIGRLSVGSTAETAGAVDKILRFENYAGTDPWKKRMMVVADDEYRLDGKLCWANEGAFQQACENVAEIATDLAVVALDTVKYYLKRCTDGDQPDKRCESYTCCPTSYLTRSYVRSRCTPQLLGLWNSGGLLADYQGHANRQQFTHEGLILDYDAETVNYTDVRGLTNLSKPFIFMGFGCWISDFQSRGEGALVLGDAIGEKFILNTHGAACGSFASGCGELISDNKNFNPFVIEAMFVDLQGMDPHGNPVPARVVLGEALVTALIRFGKADFASKHILLGDPAMIVDMGPPALAVSVDDVPIDETYLYQAETLDTLVVAAEIKDEEAIMDIAVEVVADGLPMPVAPDEYSAEALVDTGLTRSRAYLVTYDHIPLLGEYAVRISGRDYSGKTSSFDVRFDTGSAGFYKDDTQLKDGDVLVFGQTLRVLLARPYAFGEADISVMVDSTAASEFMDYSVVKKDADGKQWEVSFVPVLATGAHRVAASVSGFEAHRDFQYSPARVAFFAGGLPVNENGYVPPHVAFDIVVEAKGGLTGDDIAVDLDGAPYAATFTADTSGTVWTASFELELEPGTHELAVTVFNIRVTRSFRVSDEFMLIDVSVFPNPFSRETYFFYTLSLDAEAANLMIYTVSGREILDVRVDGFAGYNQYMWDGLDAAGDRVANGTYIYRLLVKSSSGDKEFVGRLVKIE